MIGYGYGYSGIWEEAEVVLGAMVLVDLILLVFGFSNKLINKLVWLLPHCGIN